MAVHDPSLDVVKKSLEAAASEALAWFRANCMQANPEKFQVILFSRQNVQSFEVVIENYVIKAERCVKLLGVQIDTKFSFDDHIAVLCKKASSQIKALVHLSVLNEQCKANIYHAFILSNFTYSNLVWHMFSTSSTRKIQAVQERCLRYIYQNYDDNIKQLYSLLSTPTLYMSRLRKLMVLVFKVIGQNVPSFLNEMYKCHGTPYELRDNLSVELPKFDTVTYGKRSLRYEGAKQFNELPVEIKKLCSCKIFYTKVVYMDA